MLFVSDCIAYYEIMLCIECYLYLYIITMYRYLIENYLVRRCYIYIFWIYCCNLGHQIQLWRAKKKDCIRFILELSSEISHCMTN